MGPEVVENAWEPDARLIAAAPELAEACIALVSGAASVGDVTAMARAALRKAGVEP